MTALWTNYKHLAFPAIVGLVGGCLVGYFSAAYPWLVGALSGGALALAVYRRPPMI